MKPLYNLKFVLGLCALMNFSEAFSQSTNFPLNHPVYHFLERVEIKGYLDMSIISSVKPISRNYVKLIEDSLHSLSSNVYDLGSNVVTAYQIYYYDWETYDEIIHELFPKREGKLKFLYPNSRDLFAHQDKDFSIFINPVIDFQIGKNKHNYSLNDTTENIYISSRGIQIRGSLAHRVGFYTEVLDNQTVPDAYIKAYETKNDVLPGEGYIKEGFKSIIFKGTGYDYFSTKGYITFTLAKYIHTEFGKDRNFIGNGARSLFLSDFATDYLYLKFNTRIWKINYLNLFTDMIDYIPNKSDAAGAYPKKYGAFHRLGYDINKNINIGVCESVIFYSKNPDGTRRLFEFEYLNPIIFYRSVEHSLGSPDNAFLGFDGKYNFLHRFQIYAQGIIDDYNFQKRTEGKGWWGNKYAYQLGIKYIDAFWIPNLDLQFEYNRIRPYTYAHYDTSSNYAHYRQPLAHPIGANAHEFIFILFYQPLKNLTVENIFSYSQYGADTITSNLIVNWGHDIFLNNQNRPSDFDNVTLQGELKNIQYDNLRISYQFFQNIFADLTVRIRKEENNFSNSFMLGLRLNIPPKSYWF